MHVVGVASLRPGPDAEIAHRPTQLAEQVLPLADAQVVEELGAAELAELVRGQLTLAISQVVPQREEAQQLGAGHVESSVEVVRLLALLLGPFARVLDRERSDDDHDVMYAVALLGLEHHATEPRVDRETGEATTNLGEPPRLVGHGGFERAELVEKQLAIAHGRSFRWLEERERGHIAEPDSGHLQDDRREVGPQDLGLGERRSPVEIILGVEPDADAWCHAAASAGALVRRCLGDGFDRETLHLQPAAVARDASVAGIDDVANPGHGERGFSDVGAEHDTPPGMGFEDALLLAR